MSAAEAAAFITKMASVALFQPGEWVQLAIARAEDSALVGDAGLFVAQGFEYAEVGFTITPSAQGRGMPRQPRWRHSSSCLSKRRCHESSASPTQETRPQFECLNESV